MMLNTSRLLGQNEGICDGFESISWGANTALGITANSSQLYLIQAKPLMLEY